eukprot:3563815-Pleurochrysis_carterae.AAC.3
MTCERAMGSSEVKWQAALSETGALTSGVVNYTTYKFIQSHTARLKKHVLTCSRDRSTDGQ